MRKAEELPLDSPDRNTAFQAVSKYLVANPTHIVLCSSPVVLLSRKNVVGLERDALGRLSSPIDPRHMFIVKG